MTPFEFFLAAVAFIIAAFALAWLIPSPKRGPGPGPQDQFVRGGDEYSLYATPDGRLRYFDWRGFELDPSRPLFCGGFARKR